MAFTQLLPYLLHAQEENVNVVHRALDLGVDFLDSSDAYGPHANEELQLIAEQSGCLLPTMSQHCMIWKAAWSCFNEAQWPSSMPAVPGHDAVSILPA